jgi:hypothetical protein
MRGCVEPMQRLAGRQRGASGQALAVVGIDRPEHPALLPRAEEGLVADLVEDRALSEVVVRSARIAAVVLVAFDREHANGRRGHVPASDAKGTSRRRVRAALRTSHSPIASLGLRLRGVALWRSARR